MKRQIVIFTILLITLVNDATGQSLHDSLNVFFLGGFKYDRVEVICNKVEVFDDILYSSHYFNYTFKMPTIPVQKSDSLNITFIFYEINYEKKFEYNPLWYSWKELPADLFNKPKQSTYKINLDEGKNLWVRLVETSNSVMLDEKIGRYSDLELQVEQRHEIPILD